MAHRHQNVSDVSGLKVLPLSSATNTDIRAWPDMQYCHSSVSLATQLELLLLSKLGQSQIPAK